MFDKGVSAGLRIWLVFLLALVLLRYDVVLSVCLGAIAGAAGGCVVAWWQAKGAPVPPKAKKSSIPGLGDRVKGLGSDLGERGKRIPLSRLLRRKPPSLRSRQ